MFVTNGKLLEKILLCKIAQSPERNKHQSIFVHSSNSEYKQYTLLHSLIKEELYNGRIGEEQINYQLHFTFTGVTITSFYISLSK